MSMCTCLSRWRLRGGSLLKLILLFCLVTCVWMSSRYPVSSLKRKRSLSSPYKRPAKRSRPTGSRKRHAASKAASSLVVPGYTRTGGFYRYGANPVGPEIKFKDTAYGIAGTLTISRTLALCVWEGGTASDLTLIPQGAGESNRIGRKVTCKSINMKGHVALNDVAGAPSQGVVYMWLVIDHQTNGALPVITDIWKTPIGGGFTDNVSAVLRNMQNMQRFTVMKPIVLSIPSGAYRLQDAAAGNAIPGGGYVPFDQTWHLNDLVMDYAGATGGLAEIKSNNIYLAFGADNNTSYDGTIATIQARLYYTDA